MSAARLLDEVSRAIRERLPPGDPLLRVEVFAGEVHVVIVEGTMCPTFSATVARQVAEALPEFIWDHSMVRRLSRLRALARAARKEPTDV